MATRKNHKKRTRRILLWVGGGVLALVLAAGGALAFFNRPLSTAETHAAITERLQRVVDESTGVSSALLTVAPGGSATGHEFAVGTTGPAASDPARTDSQYHSASVGKTMLAAVFGQLVDEGVVSFDDPLNRWVDAEVLAGLFVVDGKDHWGDVTLGQLLEHTSGVADCFEGPVTSGPTMAEIITSEPDRLFTPADLIAFTRDHQVARGTPGEVFAYSDTGYVLLGLALETIEGNPYAKVLEGRLFGPLGMTDSYLMTHFAEPSGILSLDAHAIDLGARNALSVDWAGGGVVTTMADLLTFMRALEGGELVSDAVHERMTTFEHELQTGIGYGSGVMQIRFRDLSPLLFSMTDVHGGVGATGTFALYDPSNDTHYIANFGSLDFAEKAIEELIEIRLIFDRLQE